MSDVTAITGKTTSWAGTTISPGEDANPCGLIGAYRFTDRFMIADGATPIKIKETGIAYWTDKVLKFGRGKNSETTQWADPDDEHLMVWY